MISDHDQDDSLRVRGSILAETPATDGFLRQRGSKLRMLIAAGVRALSVLAALALTVVVARHLTADEAGLVFVSITIIVAASTVGRWGTDTLVLKRTAGRGLPSRDLASFIVLAVLGSLLSGLLGVGVIAVMATPILSLETALEIVIAVVGSSIAVIGGAALRGQGRIGAGLFVEAGMAPLVASLAIVSWGIVEGETRPGVALGIYAASWVAAGLLGIFLTGAVSELGRGCRVRLIPGSADRRVLTHMTITAAVFYLQVWSPVLALGAWGLHADAAYYTVAARTTSFVSFLPVLQNLMLAPRFANLHARDETRGLTALASKSARLALVAGCPLAAAISIWPKEILSVFGPGFDEAVSPSRALAIFAVVTIAFGPVNPVMLTCDLEGLAARLNVVCLVLGASIMVFAAPFAGSMGVASASGVVGATYAVIASAAIRRGSNVGTRAWDR